MATQVMQGMRQGLGGSSAMSLGPALFKVTREGKQERQDPYARRDWTEQEVEMLAKMIEKDVEEAAHVDWRNVCAFLKHDVDDCKRRYLNMPPSWTSEEDVQLLEYYVAHGAQWTMFTRRLPYKRAPREAKQRWMELEKVLSQHAMKPEYAVERCSREKLMDMFSSVSEKDAAKTDRKLETQLKKKRTDSTRLASVTIPASQLHLYNLDPETLGGEAVKPSIFDTDASSHAMLSELEKQSPAGTRTSSASSSMQYYPAAATKRPARRRAPRQSSGSDAESDASADSTHMHKKRRLVVPTDPAKASSLDQGSFASASEMVSAVGSLESVQPSSLRPQASLRDALAEEEPCGSDAEHEDDLLLMSSSIPHDAAAPGFQFNSAAPSERSAFAFSSAADDGFSSLSSASIAPSPFPRFPSHPSPNALWGNLRGASSPPESASAGGDNCSTAGDNLSTCWGALSIQRDYRSAGSSTSGSRRPVREKPVPAPPAAGTGMVDKVRWLAHGISSPPGSASLPSQILSKSKSMLLGGFDSALTKTSLTVSPEMRMDFSPDQNFACMASSASPVELRSNVWLSAFEPYRCIVKGYFAENSFVAGLFSRRWCAYTLYHAHRQQWSSRVPDTASMTLPKTLWSYLSPTRFFSRAFARAAPQAQPA
eukprot:TRINITY_DN27388_c0_g1_i1.p1 TRINITY_DN27388_c0_g1~~TRINITY_DN27388_c0_g1_i1.p1  ORF type:complete len:704 (+),score=215.07 TRINITY_DN27388_c0_g1_i1:155-2113(+)